MTLLSIGDFSRATHLSVKALRYYHETGVLDPAEIDPTTGYRRYDVAQISDAQVIRRFRDLGMPVDEVRSVVQTSDLAARSTLIAQHLRRMETELGRTQAAVASLRDLLEHPGGRRSVEHRRVPAVRAATITADVAAAGIGPWVQGAFGELYATVAAQGLDLSGLAGGEYADGLFAGEHGTATVYLPVSAGFDPVGRVQVVQRPAVDLAILGTDGPDGPDRDIDRVYGALAAHVAQHEIGVDGPVHELYPVHRHHTLDPALWRTEVGWPIFATVG